MPSFQELDFQETALGDLSLRRRRILALDDEEVWEIKLGDSFLMSSLFTEVEKALARLGLEGLPPGGHVAIGGLGLGYTAQAALGMPGISSVLVVEALAPVIDWHRRGLVPLGFDLTQDPRCRFAHQDFFAAVQSATLDPESPGRRFDAILLDIDHSPRNLLAESNAAFYSAEGLKALVGNLQPEGRFALWSDDPPDDDFIAKLKSTFSIVQAHTVAFYNPLLDRDSSSTVYVASLA